jgi:hypothetical protein
MNLTVVSAQTGRAQTPQTFASFLVKFKAAVMSGDKQTVASMTKLPFMFEGEELDEYGFIRKLDDLFDKQIKGCLRKARPVRDGIYFEVTCVETTLMFRKIEAQYKFVEIGVND